MPVVALSVAVAVSVTVVIAVHGHWRGLQLLVQVGIAAGIPGGVVRAQATAAWSIREVFVWWICVVDGWFVLCVVFFNFQFRTTSKLGQWKS